MWCVFTLCFDKQKFIYCFKVVINMFPWDLCFCDLFHKFFPLGPDDMGLNLRYTLVARVALGRYLMFWGPSDLLRKMGATTTCTSHGYSAMPGASPPPHQQTPPPTGTPHRRDGGTLLSSRSAFCRSSFRDFSDFSSFCLSILSSSYKTNTITEAILDQRCRFHVY